MDKKKLSFHKSDKCQYMTIFRNNHGRVIFLSIILVDGWISIKECFYLDRVGRPEPKRLTTSICKVSSLLNVIKNELDKSFEDIEFSDDRIVKKETLISEFLDSRKKKILIFVADGNVIKTIFKSKYRREIYLELSINGNLATITQCYYVDRRAKGLKNPPQGIITVRFEFSLERLLKIVNSELEGGFTDVLISHAHTLTLDRPICGAI